MKKLAIFLFTVPMAAFGFLHFGPLEFSLSYVPVWLPFPAFWVWLAGAGLLLFSLSVLLGRKDRIAAYALTIELLLFVMLIHVPKAVSGDFSGLIAIFRDVAMAGGALFFAEEFSRDRSLSLFGPARKVNPNMKHE